MINRRIALGIIASASTIGASDITLAKEKKHLNGKALLGVCNAPTMSAKDQ